ncbi:hypothetical protein ACTFIR_000926 [Dictyostelium discoideum]
MFLVSKKGEKLKIIGDASIPEMNIPDCVRYNHSYVLKYKSFLDGKISESDYLSFNCNNDIFDDDDDEEDDHDQDSLEKPLDDESSCSQKESNINSDDDDYDNDISQTKESNLSYLYSQN